MITRTSIPYSCWKQYRDDLFIDTRFNIIITFNKVTGKFSFVESVCGEYITTYDSERLDENYLITSISNRVYRDEIKPGKLYLSIHEDFNGITISPCIFLNNSLADIKLLKPFGDDIVKEDLYYFLNNNIYKLKNLPQPYFYLRLV